MNRVMRSTVVLAAALGAISCKGDPTDSLRNGIDHLVATPSVLFIGGPDSTQSVLIEAVDDQGNRLSGTFSLVSATAGLSVVQDSGFNNVYNSAGQLVPPKNWTRAKYNITTVAGSGVENAVFAVGGKQITVPVRIVAVAAGSISLSTAAANAGDTVVATAPANFRFKPNAVVSVPGGVVVGLGTSADSSQISFVVGPSINGVVTVTNLVLQYSPALATYSATSAVPLLTPAVSNIATTFSTSTPNINDLVTVTAPAGYKFLPNATVTFGTDDQAVTSVASDSNSLVFRAHKAGASGTVTIGNVALSFLTNVGFSTTVTSTATVGATVTSLTGTDQLATAPLVAVPATGNTGGVIDAGAFATGPAVCSGTLGGPCRIYKIVLTSTSSFSVSATWQGTTDIGVYFTDSSGATLVGSFGCDAKGAGAGGQPETCTQTAFAAGTYYMIVDSFAPFYGPPNNVDPTDITIAFTGL